MKDKIISEIQRLALELGEAPGNRTFLSETGIKESEWKGIFWARWGDALLDAGLQPNDIQKRHEDEFLLRKYCEATLHFNKPPTKPEMRMYSKQVDGFPSYTTMQKRFGSMANIRQRARTWAGENEAFSAVVHLIQPADVTTRSDTTPVNTDGWVYLLQSGAHYKIGRSQELERRVKQISVALPEKVELVHSIKTDDPSGIETYWHNRFKEKRLNGEWFALSLSEVRAFKRRKFQ